MFIKRSHDKLVLIVGCIPCEWHHAFLGGIPMFLVLLIVDLKHLETTYLTSAHCFFGGDDHHRTHHQLLMISLDYFKLLTLLIVTLDVCPNVMRLHVQIIL